MHINVLKCLQMSFDGKCREAACGFEPNERKDGASLSIFGASSGHSTLKDIYRHLNIFVDIYGHRRMLLTFLRKIFININSSQSPQRCGSDSIQRLSSEKESVVESVLTHSSDDFALLRARQACSIFASTVEIERWGVIVVEEVRKTEDNAAKAKNHESEPSYETFRRAGEQESDFERGFSFCRNWRKRIVKVKPFLVGLWWCWQCHK